VGRQRRRVDSICRTAHERVPPLRARPGLAVSVLSVPRALAASADHRAASSPHELGAGAAFVCSHSFCRALVAGAFFVVGDPNLGSVSGVCVCLSLSVCLCAHM
jgi:hypothetical protein